MSEENTDQALEAQLNPDAAQDPVVEVEAEETDWKAEARKWEQRAKENKTAADELASIREAQKSDADRAAEALAQAQAEAESATAELLRYRAAAAHGITDPEDIDLFLTGKDEETLEKQAKALAARTKASAGPRAPKPDPNQGRSGASPSSTADQFASAIEQSFTR